MMWRPRVVAAVFALLSVIACNGADPSAQPIVSSFTADPAQIEEGGTSTLEWSVSGATSLTLLPDGVDVTGRTSRTVAPEVTTTYTLVAANGTVERDASTTIIVGDLPVIESFAAVADLGFALVNPGVPISVAWSVVDADTVTIEGPGVPVQGVDLTGSMEVTPPTVGATYTLRATNGAGPISASVVVSRDVPAFSVLIAGQSNAKGSNVSAAVALDSIAAAQGVHMLGNDYVWKVAYEPTGDCVGHRDLVSIDPRDRTEACTDIEQNVAGVSPGVSFGNHLAAATGGEVFIVPAAVFGSALNGSRPNDNWQPGSDPFDTRTLFGSAANRARLSGIEAGAPLGHTFENADYGAVLWYQGESDATESKWDAFFADTDTVLAGFEDVLGAPIIIVQLSSRGGTDSTGVARNLWYQRVREVQRRMAEGARGAPGDATDEARFGRHLVVTHDLPMGDNSHLSVKGQFELGRRVSLAVREHLLGEDVDGTGPRLLQVVSSSTEVRVVLDRPVTEPAFPGAEAYSGYFSAFAGGDELMISQIERDPTNPSIVLITLSAAVDGEVEVRYMPPAGAPSGVRSDVVRSETCTDPIPGTTDCLPLPAFGMAASDATLSALRLMVLDDDED